MEPRTCQTCEHWGNARNPCRDCWPGDRTSWIADKDKRIAKLRKVLEEALGYVDEYLPECHVAYDEDGEDGRISKLIGAALAVAEKG